MKRVLIVIASFMLTSTALAADLAPAPAEPVAPAAAPYNWTGFYAGVNVGVGWNYQDYKTAPLATLVTDPYEGSLGWGRHLSGSPHAGVVGGAQIGYNWQFDPLFVLGAEADFQFSGASAKNNSSATTGATISNDIESKTPWFGTVRARLGTTWFDPRLLIYATGGLAYGQEKISATQTATSDGTVLSVFPLDTKKTRIGFAAGAGAQWAFSDHWSIGLEYLFVDFQSNKITKSATTVLGGDAVSTDAVSLKANSLKENLVRATLNYKF